MHALRHVGAINEAALIEVGPQARTYALDMLAQERAPGLCLGAIGSRRMGARILPVEPGSPFQPGRFD